MMSIRVSVTPEEQAKIAEDGGFAPWSEGATNGDAVAYRPAGESSSSGLSRGVDADPAQQTPAVVVINRSPRSPDRAAMRSPDQAERIPRSANQNSPTIISAEDQEER